MTLSNIRAMVEKLCRDTEPTFGALPEEDETDFDLDEQLDGWHDNDVDIIRRGQRWGEEARNRVLNPALHDILSALVSIENRLPKEQPVEDGEDPDPLSYVC